MKGVALSIAADATLVDITHDVEPQDVHGAALILTAAYRYFPPGTVFVAVVDPGVGTARRAIAVEAGSYRFVAPDNGLLSTVVAEVGDWRAVDLVDPRFHLPVVSRTFEGRDRFAPVGAWLALGTPLEAFGPPCADIVQLTLPVTRRCGDALEGEVTWIDRFGNAITNLAAWEIEEWRGTSALTVVVRDNVEIPGVVATYAQAPAGQACALYSSNGYIEIAVPRGHAASALGLHRGSRIALRRRPHQ